MRKALLEILMRVRAAWRYRWYALLAAWVVAMIGWGYVFVIPEKYESSARVYVDTDSLLRPLLRGLTIQTNVDSRLQLMTKTLLSRPNIEKVARETDLDITAKTPAEMERLISQIQGNIRLQGGRRQNLYTISFEHNDPHTAKNVVQALMTIFVEKTLGDTRQDTNVAQKFIDKQIQEYEARLIEAENRLTEFKRKHVGMLPGQGGTIFQRLEAAKGQYQQAMLELRQAQTKRDELQKQYEEAKISVAQGTVKPTSAIDTRILSLQQNLDQLLLRFTKQHPDVVELQATIKELEAQKKQEDANSPGQVIQQNNMLEQLKLSVGQAEAELVSARVSAEEYKNRVDKLTEMVTILPEIETELKRLNRDYDINKQRYDSLVTSRETARISESADATGDSVNFKIIESPSLPAVPKSPNRPLLSSLVLVVALLLGGALAFVISELNPVVMDSGVLRKLTDFPVLGSVSRVWTPELAFKRKLEVGAFFSVVFGLVLVYAAVIIVYSYAGDAKWLLDLRGMSL